MARNYGLGEAVARLWPERHGNYREMCALAATGQLDGGRMQELSGHLAGCGVCRRHMESLSELGVQVGAFLAAAKSPAAEVDSPEGMRARFLARLAAEERIAAKLVELPRQPLVAVAPAEPRESLIDTRPSRLRFASVRRSAAIVTACAAAAAVGFFTGQRRALPRTPAGTAISQTAAVVRDGAASSKPAEMTVSEIADTLLARKRAAARHGLAATGNQTRSPVLPATDERLRRKRELQSARSLLSDALATKILRSAGVYSAGGSQRRGAAGRVYYVDGVALVLYAYSLDTLVLPATQVAFRVWGVWGRTRGEKNPSRNLGLLRKDETAPGRWVLTVNDPKLLAQLHSVIVTAEQPGERSGVPHGNRLLSASLATPLEHPSDGL